MAIPPQIENTINTPIYRSFAHAKNELADIAPIDYFFARELSLLFTSQNINKHDSSIGITTSAQQVAFHLLVALSKSLREGHTCLPVNIIANQQFGYACDDFGTIAQHGYWFPSQDVIEKLLSSIDLSYAAGHPIVFNNNKLYMRRYFTFEQAMIDTIAVKTLGVDQQINTTTVANKQPNPEHIKQCINEFFPAATTEEANNEIDWQKIAVANALNKDFSVIAGGPGTGKTYTVTKLLAALIYLDNIEVGDSDLNDTALKMALVAPTGKAAQRLSESLINAINGFKGIIADNVLAAIPTDTQTIHRLLGVIPNSPNFKHDEDNLLNIDVLLIDEVSMVDLAMMARIFRALPTHCKVILLGDADQLPSVSAGSVLNDIAPRPFIGYSEINAKYLIDATGEKVPGQAKRQIKPCIDYVTFLTKSRRFDSQGGIGLIAKSVIQGNYSLSWSILNQSNGENQIYHIQHDTMIWLTDLVEQYYLPMFYTDNLEDAFSLFSKFRILCAMRVGQQGVDKFNELVTNILIEKNVIKSGEVMYQGRPIMITENNYVQGLYNGDIGFIWRHESGHLMAVFEDLDNRFKWIMTSKLPNYDTVYAMTIHKTQGSEFSHVAMVLPNQKDNRLLSRELLYTGITRAKKRLSIATSGRVWRQGVERNVVRHSGYSD